MIIAGLTGSVATGKSFAAKCFSRRGAIIIDADLIAHEVVEQGRPAWQEIVDTFGRNILQTDGRIDRKRLGGIIFNAPDRKEQLNRIVHPRVFEEISRRLAAINGDETQKKAVVLLDVPLLFETGMDRDISDIIVVYTPPDIQLERLMQRDGINREDALARINAQMPVEEKRPLADFVIDNSGTIEETESQVDAIFATLKEKALVKSHGTAK
ncbi:MAG: dephospho-CoA kinase [Thermodesulfobacteriota bacterium]|nr:dephospho-CoA kinase [Thermodesulfobacteriota bacterium]